MKTEQELEQESNETSEETNDKTESINKLNESERNTNLSKSDKSHPLMHCNKKCVVKHDLLMLKAKFNIDCNNTKRKVNDKHTWNI